MLGGTFNPPHLGHLHAAHLAKDALGLDKVLHASEDIRFVLVRKCRKNNWRFLLAFLLCGSGCGKRNNLLLPHRFAVYGAVSHSRG